MGGVVRITLDAETFKALASPTRLTVLRALDERRKTLTEISRDLDLNKATVHEHLALLTAAQLVRKRDDEGRKWIYYELTWRGQKLMHPQETTTFSVLLGLGVAAAGGGIGLLAYSLTRAADQVLPTLQGPGESAKIAANTADDASSAPADGSTGGAGSSTASSSGTSAPTETGAPQNGAPAAGVAAPNAASTTTTAATPEVHHGFLDDGGTLAIALLLAGVLFAVLAWLLRRRIRPGKAVPPTTPEDA
jgi:DNA-binding transcriptional ArsR family regulator